MSLFGPCRNCGHSHGAVSPEDRRPSCDCTDYHESTGSDFAELYARVAELKRSLIAQSRELHRLQCGVPVEGDLACAASLKVQAELDAMRKRAENAEQRIANVLDKLYEETSATRDGLAGLLVWIDEAKDRATRAEASVESWRVEADRVNAARDAALDRAERATAEREAMRTDLGTAQKENARLRARIDGELTEARAEVTRLRGIAGEALCGHSVIDMTDALARIAQPAAGEVAGATSSPGTWSCPGCAKVHPLHSTTSCIAGCSCGRLATHAEKQAQRNRNGIVSPCDCPDCDAATSELTALHEDVARLRQHAVTVEEQRDAATSEVATLRAEVERVTRELDAARKRARDAGTRLVAEIGADGPEDVDATAARAVDELRRAAKERDAALAEARTAREERDRLAGQVEAVREAWETYKAAIVSGDGSSWVAVDAALSPAASTGGGEAKRGVWCTYGPRGWMCAPDSPFLCSVGMERCLHCGTPRPLGPPPWEREDTIEDVARAMERETRPRGDTRHVDEWVQRNADKLREWIDGGSGERVIATWGPLAPRIRALITRERARRGGEGAGP